MKNIRALANTNPPRHSDKERLLHVALSDFHYKSLIVAPSETVGIEIEIEHIADIALAHSQLETTKLARYFWQVDKDGSLRDDGVEYRSVPMHSQSAEAALTELYQHIRSTYRGAKFSVRCGIHVHIDVGDLTAPQVLSLMALYTAFEHLFFTYVPEERKNSNYCVPFRDIDIRGMYPYSPTEVFDHTNFFGMMPGLEPVKYMALNSGHLGDFNTLEFRHLPGMWEIPTIVSFIKCMCAMKRYVKADPQGTALKENILTINTTSHYTDFMKRVFQPLDVQERCIPRFDTTALAKGVETAKAWYLEQDKRPQPSLQSIIRNKGLLKKFEKLSPKANKPGGIKELFDIPPPQVARDFVGFFDNPAGGLERAPLAGPIEPPRGRNNIAGAALEDAMQRLAARANHIMDEAPVVHIRRMEDGERFVRMDIDHEGNRG